VLTPPVAPLTTHKPILVTERGVHDFAGKIYIMGKIPRIVKEYGTPALHVMSDRTTVRNFAWRGSMESLHVGSRPFNGEDMRKRHDPIKVTLDRLFCDDIGEDGVSIQPRANVLLKNSQFRGNYGIVAGEGENPGQDKVVQIDGATVTIENCNFFNALSPIRAKANSTVIVRNCKFIHCGSCVSGDGMRNPNHNPPNGLPPYDNGKAGPSRIIVEDCECWDCKEVARAFPGCTIELHNVKIHSTWRRSRESGGTVIVK
jgi:Right handed beta helix region